MNPFEVAILGGGPAGLSAALVLSRAGRYVAVIDSGVPRNQASPGVRGFLSRDGVPPATLKAIAWEQIKQYGVATFLQARAESVRRIEAGGFEVAIGGFESVEARFVLLAVGMVDVLPDIPGFHELWGRDVIHCAFCHGAEHRGRAWGLIARTRADVENAHRFLHWTHDLIVFADSGLSVAGGTVHQLARQGIRVVREPLKELATDARGRLVAVRLADGSEVARDTLVYQPAQRQTDLVSKTGVALVDGRVHVSQSYETSLRGLFAAGDLTAGHQDVASAVASGSATAKRITQRLADLNLGKDSMASSFRRATEDRADGGCAGWRSTA